METKKNKFNYQVINKVDFLSTTEQKSILSSKLIVRIIFDDVKQSKAQKGRCQITIVGYGVDLKFVNIQKKMY